MIPAAIAAAAAAAVAASRSYSAVSCLCAVTSMLRMLRTFPHLFHKMKQFTRKQHFLGENNVRNRTAQG
jgi:UDP-N-acetylmuramoylalanine-D-glutamate ligase